MEMRVHAQYWVEIGDILLVSELSAHAILTVEGSVEFTRGSEGEQRCDVLWYKRAAFPIVCTSTFILLSRENLNETISCAPHAYDLGKLESEHRNTGDIRATVRQSETSVI